MPIYPKPTEVPTWGTSATTISGWEVSTAYTSGTFVSNGGAIFKCTTSGTSASSGSGPSGTGTGITDGTAAWAYSRPAYNAGVVVEPSAVLKASGFTNNLRLPRGTLNWLFSVLSSWVAYLSSLGSSLTSWVVPQSFTQTLSATNPPGTAWAPSTAYTVDTVRNNDTGKIYIVTTAGTSAGSGGPTGTGSAITDGTVVWKYLRSAAPAVTGTSSTTGQPGVSGIATVGNADGLSGQGFGTGSGVAATGGATGNGGTFTGGATSGAGVVATGTGGGNGATTTGQGAGAGLLSTGGATGVGVDAVGSLAAAGMRANPFVNLVPTASAPSAPADGDVWYDSGSHTLKVRLNGATVTITTA